MAKASEAATINPLEAEHFGSLARDWWDPKGSSAMLHKLNPVRLAFVREAINAHLNMDACEMRPLTGKSVLDVGCGAGLMCEPLARLGAKVTGLDAAPENVEAAEAHATEQGLRIEYHCKDVAEFRGSFDLVTSMEVIEHVNNPGDFFLALAARLKPGGLMVLSTPNRTALSKVAMITLAEGLGAIPRGTHDWDKFLTPEELESFAVEAGLVATASRGISFSPNKGFILSERLDLNYLFAFKSA